MEKSTIRKSFPIWLRFLGWLGFGVLSLAFLLIVTRWWVMNRGHQRTRDLVNQGRKSTAVLKNRTAAAVASATQEPVAAKGLPLEALPHFGAVLTGNKDEWMECVKVLRDIDQFTRIGFYRGDGDPSFRRILPSMGITVPESMTEAEAAQAFLNQAKRFSDILAKWREAVSKGPMERSADAPSDSNIRRFAFLSYSMTSLALMMGEAQLAVGDSQSAWEATESVPERSYEFQDV